MQTVLEQGSIDKPLTFDVGLIQLSFIPVCSLNTCSRIVLRVCTSVLFITYGDSETVLLGGYSDNRILRTKLLLCASKGWIPALVPPRVYTCCTCSCASKGLFIPAACLLKTPVSMYYIYFGCELPMDTCIYL